MIRHCQICAIPIFTQRDMGTEKNGDANPFFCSNCYRDGHFVEESRAYSGLTNFAAPLSMPLFFNGTGMVSGFPQYMPPRFPDYREPSDDEVLE